MKKYFLHYWKCNLTATIVTLISGFFPSISAITVAELLNALVNSNWEKFMIAFIAFSLVCIFDIGVGLLKRMLQAKSIEKMNTALRFDISEKLCDLSTREYSNNQIGDYISWFQNDIEMIEKNGFQQIFNVIGNITYAVVSLMSLFYFHYSLVLIALISLIVMSIIPKLLNKKIAKIGESYSNAQEMFVTNLKDELSGFPVFQAFNLSKRFADSIMNISGCIEREKFQFKTSQAKFESISQIVNYSLQLLLNFYLGYLVFRGTVNVGVMLGAGNLFGAFFAALQDLSANFIGFGVAKPILKKLDSIISNEKDGTLELCSLKHAVEVKNLSFCYDDKKVLQNTSMLFEKGKKYAITGESGSGKTTLLKILMGHLRNYTGNVVVDGEEINNYSQNSINNAIAYVNQNIYLFNQSILENITLGREYQSEELENALKRSALLDSIHDSKIALETIVGENGCNLSGGQRQRIAIARALLHKKLVIILDEGTSALDRENSKAIEKELIGDDQLTVIVVTHHLSRETENMYDKVYAI